MELKRRIRKQGVLGLAVVVESGLQSFSLQVQLESEILSRNPSLQLVLGLRLCLFHMERFDMMKE